jgi:hypothetical protein
LRGDALSLGRSFPRRTGCPSVPAEFPPLLEAVACTASPLGPLVLCTSSWEIRCHISFCFC